MPRYKVKTSEIDGVELDYETEVLLDVSNISNESEVFSPTEGQTLSELLAWVRNNATVSYQRYFSDSIINIDAGTVKQMHSPIMDGELCINGEVYIL